MDLNYLLHRHQISLMRASAAASVEARHAHEGLARGYAKRIAGLRTLLAANQPILAAQ
ncbi:hypothetical protein ACCC88_17270 [Sphingomonas sp. Sphisp140]|uniref:hypothetical protein n=1 Tax=unclassified Sphingomonas TaxID=196159 RepID=UPI0039AFA665